VGVFYRYSEEQIMIGRVFDRMMAPIGRVFDACLEEVAGRLASPFKKVTKADLGDPSDFQPASRGWRE
jgi:hypothetical protein